MRILLFAFVFSLGLYAAQAAGPDLSKDINIANQKFVLSNGLTLIVHEDHKAPILAVNLWYHVGSKNEKPGKTGFAHLFEHLMFTGSQHLQTGHNQRAFFQTMEQLGATDMNGTTSEDRTDFFENVPKNALDVALWMESDRMGSLLGAVDQVKLDEQRGVVQNEKRQGENQPYGVVEELMVKATSPANHPYSWTVIGSMADLDAASLDDVRNWFKTYYGAANATLVIAGDIQAGEALAKVKKYFGSIPSGPPVARFTSWTAKMGGVRRQSVSDHVPQARLYEVWNAPRYGEVDATRLDLLSDILSQGKTSRLYKRLVYDDQIATDAEAYLDPREINSQFGIIVTLRPGQDPAKAEQAVREEMARLLEHGPTEEELQRVKTRYFAGFIRGIERLGGFGGVSDILAMNQTYRGDPNFYKTILDQVSHASTADLTKAGREWLSDGVYILNVLPFPSYQTAKTDVDRSQLPQPEPLPQVKFPALQRVTLSNGLKIILAERHGLPLTDFELLVNAGYAADQFATPGTASLAMDMIGEGTKSRSALEISDQLARLGASLNTHCDLDSSTVHFSAITPNLPASLDLFADVVLHPSFPEADFKRVQQDHLAGIQREKTDPRAMAMRILPELLFGQDHAYGNPLTGSGTEKSVAQMSAQDMEKFYQTWFKASNATLVVVGDAELGTLTPTLEKLFGAWPSGAVPVKNIGPVSEPAASAVYLVDRPGSLQSMIMAADIAPSTSAPDEIALETMNTILGGVFTSRINMNLREDKHWAYGARSVLTPARGPSPFIAWAPVQTDKTKESMVEIDKELRNIVGEKPVTEEELNSAKKDETLKLPGQWETEAHVADSIARLVRFGWPDDYFVTYPAQVRALTQSDVQHAAEEAVHPGHLVWVVIGDRSKVEAGIRELGWGEIHLLNPDGQPVE
ncbi:MAG TPA: pitrilysin family protein [Candidatus Saccharimonadales bacterium]|nr:pitrilysin family protein [Candidatus Saccharimonadales bacterium]